MAYLIKFGLNTVSIFVRQPENRKEIQMTTPQDIRDAIEQFLTELYEKKCAEAQKKRHGVTDEKKLQSIENDLTQHTPSNWISQNTRIPTARAIMFIFLPKIVCQKTCVLRNLYHKMNIY